MDEGHSAQTGEVPSGKSPGHCAERRQGWNPGKVGALGRLLAGNNHGSVSRNGISGSRGAQLPDEPIE